MVTSGLVVRSYSGYYYVDCAGVMITCKVKGHMKQKRFSLCTGDRVKLEVNPDKADEGMITAVLPRSNYLERPTVANLDLLVITLALVQPDFSFLIADKLLVLAEAANIPVLLVLTKADLATEEQGESIADLYRKTGYETFVISSKTGEGIDALRRRLEGKITAFGGPSGVGKSSALNAIQPGVMITCKVKGHMKQKRFSLCTGDRVQVEVNPDKADEGMITAVLPRRNYLDRPTVANLDLLVITLALVQPDFSFLIADKLLVLAEAANIPVLLVLSKADLATEEQRETIASVYRKIGYETFVISSKTGEGIDALRRRLEGKVTAFGGPSGVGKSSALNAIQPGVFRTTGEISTKISRGKHTTRYTELIPFNGGYLADTPGFGNVMMENLEPDLLPACFPEFRQFEATCKFSPCSHTHEPVCGVKDAVQENRIASSRYASYLSILEELKENKARNRR